MRETITVIPDNKKWLTTDEAAVFIGKSTRVVQKLAKDGMVTWKSAERRSHPKARVYDAADLQRFAAGAEPAPTNGGSAIVARRPESRGTDMAMVVSQIMTGRQNELENIVARILEAHEKQIALIMHAQKAEADANRERLQAEREEARQRWEIQRQDRLDAIKRRNAPVKPSAKARSARA